MPAGVLLTFTSGDGLLLAGLLAAGLVLLCLSEFVRIPYPIVLVLGGLAIAFIPGMPHIELPPDLVPSRYCLRSSTASPSSPRSASCVRTYARSGCSQSGSS